MGYKSYHETLDENQAEAEAMLSQTGAPREVADERKPVFTYVDLCNAVHAHRNATSRIMRLPTFAEQEAAFAESVATLRRSLETIGLDVSGLDWTNT